MGQGWARVVPAAFQGPVSHPLSDAEALLSAPWGRLKCVAEGGMTFPAPSPGVFCMVGFKSAFLFLQTCQLHRCVSGSQLGLPEEEGPHQGARRSWPPSRWEWSGGPLTSGGTVAELMLSSSVAGEFLPQRSRCHSCVACRSCG